jgi:hypothetical protein
MVKYENMEKYKLYVLSFINVEVFRGKDQHSR